jgi:hypothetical protein
MPNTTFDKRSLIINGKRELIFSGAVHYPRSTPALWPRIIRESRKAGLNCIETYVFWNGHELHEGQYNFTDRYDLGQFIDTCANEGLYVILRIGPYICAETSFGGLPWWLITKPGMITRTRNKPFMTAMERWVRVLMAQIGDRQITRGGPIILAQLENEYCNVKPRYGTDGQKYLKWCAELGPRAGIEVPLIMCEGAPRGVMVTLNGFSVWSRVDELRKKQPNQPALWTEHWPAWYDTWGEPHHVRTSQDISFEVLRFFAASGTGVNYYMWHGGTNFSREEMFLQAASYDFDGPLDEYGLPTNKSQDLARLHRFLANHADFLLKGRIIAPRVLAKGTDRHHTDGVVAYPFRLKQKELTIVVNGSSTTKAVTVGGTQISLPARGGAALLGSKTRRTVVYQTWAVPRKKIRRVMKPASAPLRFGMIPEPLPTPKIAGRSFEPVQLPHNMLPATGRNTDFGWYRTIITSRTKRTVELTANVADFLSTWVNGKYVGVVPDRFKEDRTRPADFQVKIRLPLRKGKNEILLLVTALGLIKGDWMINAPMSEEKKGLISKVRIDGKVVKSQWEFMPGLLNECLRLFDPVSACLVGWNAPTRSGNPLRWYQTSFALSAAALKHNVGWALDIGSLQKGIIWINGQCLGRYWQLPAADETEARYNDHPNMTNIGHGKPVQTFYHIPPDWLDPGENLVVILEERGALPRNICLTRRR